MRVLAAVAVMLVGLSASGIAQTYSKGANSPKSTIKAPKSTVPLKASGANTSGNAKNLQNIEHETAKTAGKSQKSPRAPKSVALKPEKNGGNPPINFSGNSGGSAGTNKQAPNPYKGRLKQKGGGRAH